MPDTFKEKDLVWARMRGYQPWPGMVAEPPSYMPPKPNKKDKEFYCIFFFGTKNYSWCDDVKFYSKTDKREEGKKATKSYLLACEEIDKFIDTGDESSIFPQKVTPSPKPKAKRKKKEADSRKSLAVVNTEPEVNLPARARTESPTRAESQTRAASPQPGPSTQIDEIMSDTSTPKTVKQAKKSKESATKRKRDSSVLDSKKKKLDPKPKEPQVTTPKAKRKSSVVESLPEPDSAPKSDVSVRVLDDDNGESSGERITEISEAMHSLLDAPEFKRAESPPLDILTPSETLLKKNINPTDAVIGFIGLGSMGCGLVKNLLNSGHKVIIWNRTPDKADIFIQAGATYAPTPHDVAESSEIIFSCLSNMDVATKVFYGNCGVLNAIIEGKDYIEMTTITPEYSEKLNTEITERKGRYLECTMEGGRKEAESGELCLSCCGDEEVFNRAKSCLDAFSKDFKYLGETPGISSLNHSINQTIAGGLMATIAESLNYFVSEGVDKEDAVAIMKCTNPSAMLNFKANNFVNKSFPTHHVLKYVNQEIEKFIVKANENDVETPLLNIVREKFRIAERNGHADDDISTLFLLQF